MIAFKFSNIFLTKRVAFQMLSLLKALQQFSSTVEKSWWQWHWVPSPSNLKSPRSSLYCTHLQNCRHATSSLIMLPWQVLVLWKIENEMGFIPQNWNNVFKDEMQDLQLWNEIILLLQLVQAHMHPVPWQASCRYCIEKCGKWFDELNLGFGWVIFWFCSGCA